MLAFRRDALLDKGSHTPCRGLGQQPGRFAHVSSQDSLHLLDSVSIVLLRIRGDAVAGDDQMVISHVGIISREEHTDIAGDTCQDQ